MKKDFKQFNEWNVLKQEHDKKSRPVNPVFCKERDISWISFGINIGDEEDGKGQYFERPVLVIKKFNNNLFWGCALSTKIKDNNPYYLKVSTKEGLQSVIISQLRLYDTKRLHGKIGFVSKDDFQKIKTAIKKLL